MWDIRMITIIKQDHHQENWRPLAACTIITKSVKQGIIVSQTPQNEFILSNLESINGPIKCDNLKELYQ